MFDSVKENLIQEMSDAYKAVNGIRPQWLMEGWYNLPGYQLWEEYETFMHMLRLEQELNEANKAHQRRLELENKRWEEAMTSHPYPYEEYDVG